MVMMATICEQLWCVVAVEVEWCGVVMVSSPHLSNFLRTQRIGAKPFLKWWGSSTARGMSDTNSNHNSEDEEEEFDSTIPKSVQDEDAASEAMSDVDKEALNDLLDGEENITYDPEELDAIDKGEDLYDGDFEKYAHHMQHK
jgi:hypothetical protein